MRVLYIASFATGAIGIVMGLLMMSVDGVLDAWWKLSDFATRTMKVVLSGNHFIDPVLREALNNTWSLSPFEFCSMDEFNALKNNEEYYFMLPAEVHNIQTFRTESRSYWWRRIRCPAFDLELNESGYFFCHDFIL